MEIKNITYVSRNKGEKNYKIPENKQLVCFSVNHDDILLQFSDKNNNYLPDESEVIQILPGSSVICFTH